MQPVPARNTSSCVFAFAIGGGSGFGAAIARRFGEEGAKVILTDINTEGGEKVAALNPGNLIFQRQDVTNEAEWKTITDLAFSKFGRLDILVNNAGTSYRNKVEYSQGPFHSIANAGNSLPRK